MSRSRGAQGLLPGRRTAKKTRYQRDAEEGAWRDPASSCRPSTCIFGTALTLGLSVDRPSPCAGVTRSVDPQNRQTTLTNGLRTSSDPSGHPPLPPRRSATGRVPEFSRSARLCAVCPINSRCTPEGVARQRFAALGALYPLFACASPASCESASLARLPRPRRFAPRFPILRELVVYTSCSGVDLLRGVVARGATTLSPHPVDLSWDDSPPLFCPPASGPSTASGAICHRAPVCRLRLSGSASVAPAQAVRVLRPRSRARPCLPPSRSSPGLRTLRRWRALAHRVLIRAAAKRSRSCPTRA